ncbi:hypothetical protein [Sediminibacterium sp. TEGAF015]|uniref:hypothetical protein n=1 Tax=Sediminibacterium sp. TEGAF015 TaxID=575378 RepID=UPI002202508E|nr:hypothetical protein [Sediminibacterium sp. TEGAF015]BDQ11839.1 hypothetical protein TEGAF0_10560 [Sediminibacterium sp. TEGAF015]
MRKSIEILSSNEIDTIKWNWIVNNSTNGLIYAQSAFLNQLSDNWAAVIIGDYEAIIPIPYRKKWGIDYAYTPPFMQQLGLIGMSEETLNETIRKKIQKKFQYGSILLNKDNTLLANQLGALPKTNFYLSLHQPFTELEKKFKREISKTSEKLLNSKWGYNKKIHLNDCISLYQQIQGYKMPHIKTNDYEQLIQLCNQSTNNHLQYFARSIHNPNGDLYAVLLLLKDNKRIYNIINASTPEGRKENANYLLYYECLKEFSEQQLLFDFEGSSIPGIARFYSKFNPLKESYFIWHYNRLPFPLSLIP